MLNILPEIRPLLADDRLSELGPRTPNLPMKPLLQELTRELPKKARDSSFASAVLAGLWLHHDFLDESHSISQDLDTVEGSYWHGLMHRREPDYPNAKYWFRRVPGHPIWSELRRQAGELAVQTGSELLLKQGAWDPFAFVDRCESATRQGGDVERWCRQVQRIEWDLLFEYCHQRAFPV